MSQNDLDEALSYATTAAEIERLLGEGASIIRPDGELTVLHNLGHAYMSWRPKDCASLLPAMRKALEHGADVNAIYTLQSIRPIGLVARVPHAIDALKLLIEYGANVNESVIEPPIVAAAFNVDAIHVLLEHGAEVHNLADDDAFWLGLGLSMSLEHYEFMSSRFPHIEASLKRSLPKLTYDSDHNPLLIHAMEDGLRHGALNIGELEELFRRFIKLGCPVERVVVEAASSNAIKVFEVLTAIKPAIDFEVVEREGAKHMVFPIYARKFPKVIPYMTALKEFQSLRQAVRQ